MRRPFSRRGQNSGEIKRRDSKKVRKHALKGFSVFFAFFLWLYVLSSAQTKGEKIIQLEYHAPRGLAVKNQPVKEVTYSIKGPRVFIRALMHKTDKLVVDLERFREPGKTRYEINVAELGVNFPFGVELTRVEPNRLVVQLEKSLKKEVPVKAVTAGEIPSDHKMALSEIEPKRVAVEGPASLVRKIKYLETAPVELNGLTGTGAFSAPLAKPDERVKLSKKAVKFSYVVHPTRANMILKNIPVKFLSSNLIKGSNRRSVNLMVLADNEEKLEYGKKDIEVIAEIPEGSTGKVDVKLSASLPPGLHLLEIQPSKITVTVDGNQEGNAQ